MRTTRVGPIESIEVIANPFNIETRFVAERKLLGYSDDKTIIKPTISHETGFILKALKAEASIGRAEDPRLPLVELLRFISASPS